MLDEQSIEQARLRAEVEIWTVIEGLALGIRRYTDQGKWPHTSDVEALANLLTAVGFKEPRPGSVGNNATSVSTFEPVEPVPD